MSISLLPPQSALPPLRRDVSESALLRRAVRGPSRVGLLLILAFFGAFLGWGMLVPIAGGAVAPGVISPDGNVRTVQHLEGGIIATLLVRDGDKVSAGSELLLLESLQARALYNALMHQHGSLLALQARLHAEQLGAAEIDFPDVLLDAMAGQALARIVEGQRVLFVTRRAAHEAHLAVIRRRIEQSQEAIGALEAQVTSTGAQLRLIAEELAGKQQLLLSGLVPRPEVLRLQRAQAEIEGRRGEYLGTIARMQQVIGEAEVQMLTAEAERNDKISEQLDKVRLELATVSERLQASRDVLIRTVVTAPITGTVTGLRFKTVGGVIRPGEAILDIVPDQEALLIDARVPPLDIDVVDVGQEAYVRLTAYSSRGLPRIVGRVRTVSADRVVDTVTNQPYYLARVEVSRAELQRLGPAGELVPGMPAEVLIVRRQRTLVEYLIEPFREALRKSFREA